MERLTEKEREIINNMCSYDMNKTAVGRTMHMHRNTIKYHFDKIEEKTGLNPRKFYDLMKLKYANDKRRLTYKERTIEEFIKKLKEKLKELDKFHDGIINIYKTFNIIDQLVEEYSTILKNENVGDWIPCSERLPERNKNVLCCANGVNFQHLINQKESRHENENIGCYKKSK